MKSTTNYKKVSSYEAKKGEIKKCLLLYSGGLDTSIILKWIQDVYECEVITLTIDLGQQADDLESIRKKALYLGAKKAIVLDAKQEFVENYIIPALKANADYQGGYHLSTPIGRPLISKLAMETAIKEGIDAVAHGCTGKGNDQVRLDTYMLCLNPDIKIVAPVREWSMGRQEQIKYATQNNIPISHTVSSPYSYDDNLWGISAEGGVIEDPAQKIPLQEVLKINNTPQEAPNQPEEITISFKQGLPVALNDQPANLVTLIQSLNKIGAKHAIGITTHLEDRLVGLKIRDVYEQPGSEILIKAHQALEKIVSTQDENKFKVTVDQQWAYLCYNAKWFDPTMSHLNAYIDSVNAKVEGEVSIKLYKGNAEVIAITSPFSLFNSNLATFEKNTAFNQNAACGFIEIHSLAQKTACQINNPLQLNINQHEDINIQLKTTTKYIKQQCHV